MSMNCKEYKCGGTVKKEGYNGKIKRFIELAARVATQSESEDYRHGATLVKGASVINTSFNKNSVCSFGHVARIGKNGDYRLSKPCPMCYAVMKHVGVKRVVYTINNNVAGSYKL